MGHQISPSGYDVFLSELTERIRQAQLRAALSVSRELILLYWHIGQEILRRQKDEGWGAKVIDRLARDLRHAFPELKGFSLRNLKYMRALAEAYPDDTFVRDVVARITWYHNLTLLDKVKDSVQRRWYLEAAVQFGWSRDVMVHQIESGLYLRQGKAITNFERTLPAVQSDLAQQILKDPYNFDFLSLGEEAHERDLEQGLLSHIRNFLLELGVGFAFMGSQYHLEVGGEDFYIDLLFYHVRLRCYVVIDLKVVDFKPEFAGKMNFYLAAVDDLLRHAGDQPTIGIILCKTQNRTIAEYALRDMQAPLGVATYQLTEALPADLKGSLPTIEELEVTLTETGIGHDEVTVERRKRAGTAEPTGGES